MNGKPWLKHDDAGVPHILRPYPQRTLLDVMHETTRLKPEHTGRREQGGAGRAGTAPPPGVSSPGVSSWWRAGA